MKPSPRWCLYFVGISVHMVVSDRGFPFKIPSEELGWEGADLYFGMLSALMARLGWIWVCTPRTRRELRAAVPSPLAVSLYGLEQIKVLIPQSKNTTS